QRHVVDATDKSVLRITHLTHHTLAAATCPFKPVMPGSPRAGPRRRMWPPDLGEPVSGTVPRRTGRRSPRGWPPTRSGLVAQSAPRQHIYHAMVTAAVAHGAQNGACRPFRAAVATEFAVSTNVLRLHNPPPLQPLRTMINYGMGIPTVISFQL